MSQCSTWNILDTMTIAEKIKQSFEGATGLRLLYATSEEINRAISYARMPCGFFTLLSSGEVVNYSSGASERVEVTLAVITLADGEPSSYSNEERIELCKVEVLKWLKALRTSDTLRVTDEFRTQRVYDEFDDVVTGFSVTLTLEDLVPQCCDNPHEPYQVKEVEPKGFEQTILPDDGYLALSKVIVGAVTAEVDHNIKPENIVKDVTILGVEGIAESVDTRPTEAFYNYDLAAYAQKYFSRDYPNVIVYKLTPVIGSGVDDSLYMPYDCPRAVLDGVEIFNVAKDTPLDLKHSALLMCCFADNDKAHKIEPPFHAEVGNRGSLREVYTDGIDVLGWDSTLSKAGTGNTYYLRKLIIANNGNDTMNFTEINNLGTVFIDVVVEGVKRLNYNRSVASWNITENACFPDLEEIVGTYRQPQVTAIANILYAIDLERIYPKLRIAEANLIGFNTIGSYTTGAIKLRHRLLERYYTTNPALATNGLTKANFSMFCFYDLEFPNCTYFNCNSFRSTVQASNIRSIVVGRVTTFVMDSNHTRAKFVQHIEVGEGTDINLNLAGFCADYAIDATYIDDREAECLKVISNIRRGLLNKVADHTGEVDVRSITISAINTFLDSPYMSVVDATVELLADFSDKGWSLGG